MYQVFINTNKDLGNKVINNLKTYNISSIIVPSNNKVNYIKNKSNNKSIVITIDNSKNIEVIYSIKRNDKLANIYNYKSSWDEKKFDSLEELKAQLNRDKQKAKKTLQ